MFSVWDVIEVRALRPRLDLKASAILTDPGNKLAAACGLVIVPAIGAVETVPSLKLVRLPVLKNFTKSLKLKFENDRASLSITFLRQSSLILPLSKSLSNESKAFNNFSRREGPSERRCDSIP